MPYSAYCAQLLHFAWPMIRIVVAHADDGVAPCAPATTTEKHVKASGGVRGKVYPGCLLRLTCSSSFRDQPRRPAIRLTQRLKCQILIITSHTATSHGHPELYR